MRSPRVTKSPSGSRGAALLQMLAESPQHKDDGDRRSEFGLSAVALKREDAPADSLFARGMSSAVYAAQPSGPAKRKLFQRGAASVGDEQPVEQTAEPVYRTTDVFEAVETLLALKRARGEAAWWVELVQTVEAMTGAPLCVNELRRVMALWPEAWRVTWEYRQEDTDLDALKRPRSAVGADFELLVQFGASAANALVTEEELRSRRAELLSRLKSALERVANESLIVGAELPLRPVMSPAKSMLQTRQVETALSDAELAELSNRSVPESLAHLPSEMIMKARMHEAALKKLRLDAPESEQRRQRMIDAIPKLTEDLKATCVLNSRYIWPFDVLAVRVVKNIKHAGAKDEFLEMLKLLESQSNGWCVLQENKHGEGGLYVHFEKTKRKLQ